MEVQIKSIHFDATEKLQEFVQKKAAKLEKLCDEIQKVEVQLTVTKPQTAINKQAAVTVKVPGTSFYTEKLSDTFEESVDGCVDAMKAQLEKFKEKTRKN